MKIQFNNFYLFSVPVDFQIAWFRILFSNHLVVRLSYQKKGKQKEGIGEGVLYNTSALKALELLGGDVVSFFNQKFTSFQDARKKIYQKFENNPGLVCAFDLALWDLEGKVKRKSLYSFLGTRKRKKAKVIEQIFIPDNKNHLRKQLKEILEKETSIIKLKAGQNLKKDLQNIAYIQEVGNDKVKIHLDLNQSLSFKQAVWFAEKLDKSPVSMWEEPIEFSDFKQLKELKKQTKIPIILDESVKSKQDLKNASKYKTADYLNLKISRLGGLTESLSIAKKASKKGLRIIIGCSEELGIGLQAQLYLAGILPKNPPIEAIGNQRLGFDIVEKEMEIKKGRMKTSLKRKGLNVKFVPQKLWGASKRLNFNIVSFSNIENPFDFYAQHFKQSMQSKFENGLFLLMKKVNNLFWKRDLI